MVFITIVYLVLGCFIDALALILLTTPIFYPVVKVLGYDPVWFGVIVAIVVAMGVITPPVGMNVFIIKGVAKDVPLETIFKGIWPFYWLQLYVSFFDCISSNSYISAEASIMKRYKSVKNIIPLAGAQGKILFI